MQILESALAFAVAMIIFSTITTGIVELLLRICGTREKNLEKTVRSLFNSVLWPRLKGRLMALGNEAETAAKKRLGDIFVRDMISNPASSTPGGGNADRGISIPARKESQVDGLSTLAFAERLGRTEIGKAILAEGDAQLQILVQDFVRTFDRFGRAASETFRKKAQQTAMAVGVLFAVGANVEAGRLFTALMDNPNLREGLISKAEDAAKANQDAAKRLEDLAERIDNGTLEGDQSKIIKESLDKVKASINALETEGLPIGYAYYPYCSTDSVADPDCANSENGGQAVLKFLRWLVLALLAGVLIGLGGPFWFRVFSGLSQVFQVLRSFSLGRAGQAPKPEQIESTPEAEQSAKPKDVVDAFRVAAEVHAQSTVYAKRAILSPGGQPL